MEKKSISVIIPVYNAEKLIDKCVKSINDQTLQPSEVILINDGSTDNTLSVLYEIKNNYENMNIVIIDKSNGGASSARNAGIDRVSSEFLTFIDADDYIASDYILTLMDSIGSDDLVITGTCPVNKDGEVLQNNQPNASSWSKYQYMTCYGKVYRTSMIVDNNIRFKGLKIAEDVVWCATIYYHTDKIKTIPYAGYKYYVNPDSVMRNDEELAKNDVLMIVKELSKIIDKYPDTFNQKEDLFFCMIKAVVLFIILKISFVNINDLRDETVTCFDYIKNKQQKHGLKFKVTIKKHEALHTNVIVFLMVLGHKTKMLKPLLYIIRLLRK